MTTALLPSDKWIKDRHIEILVHAANGRTNAETARRMFLAEETVKTHWQVIKRRLGANDRTHAVAIALVRGLISPSKITPKEGP